VFFSFLITSNLCSLILDQLALFFLDVIVWYLDFLLQILFHLLSFQSSFPCFSSDICIVPVFDRVKSPHISLCDFSKFLLLCHFLFMIPNIYLMVFVNQCNSCHIESMCSPESLVCASLKIPVNQESQLPRGTRLQKSVQIDCR